MPWSPKQCPLCRLSALKACMHCFSLSPHTWMPSFCLWFDDPNNIWSEVQIPKLLIMLFSVVFRIYSALNFFMLVFSNFCVLPHHLKFSTLSEDFLLIFMNDTVLHSVHRTSSDFILDKLTF